MKREPLNVRIPVWLGEWLDMLADEKECTKNEAVTNILEQYYQMLQERPPATR